MTQPILAFLPVARQTFDMELARQMTAIARENLEEAGFQLIGPSDLITDLASAKSIAKELGHSEHDLVLIFQATFADSTLVTALVEDSPAPCFLWAIPEPPTGGRLRLNSLCGINLAGHALTLRKKSYDYAYTAANDQAVRSKIRTIALAGSVKRKLSSARLGVVGEHPEGMDSCHLDAAALKQKFGLQIVNLSLNDVFSLSRTISVENIDQVRQQLDQKLNNLAELEQKPLSGSLRVYSALKQIAEDEQLDGLAVRCWPEFFTELGCAACGAMSMLSDGFAGCTPLPCSCEADINGTVTQLVLQWLSGEPAFGTDLVGMDMEQDYSVIWHCGLAPLSMADPDYQAHGTIHSNRKLPLLMEFPLKPGIVTIARLNQSTGDLRWVIGRGEMLPSDNPPFSGTAGKLRFSRPVSQILDALMQEGMEHHISLTYGDYYPVLVALARLLKMPVFEL
jgi:L-fucose isomerase-like protein